jgi:hypothetical protein
MIDNQKAALANPVSKRMVRIEPRYRFEPAKTLDCLQHSSTIIISILQQRKVPHPIASDEDYPSQEKSQH